MGLDFSHGDAHWSYSGFSRFRKRIAAEIGIDLESMQGFGGENSFVLIDDPIKFLLDHSDCDGELTNDECALVAPRLRELVQNWPDDYDKQKALALAEAMEECVQEGVPLEFI